MYIADECKDLKWSISPNPYSPQCDSFETDNDEEAHNALIAVMEEAWDNIETGETRTISITLR